MKLNDRLQIITIDEAVKLRNQGKECHVLRPNTQSGRFVLYTLDEYLSGCIFLKECEESLAVPVSGVTTIPTELSDIHSTPAAHTNVHENLNNDQVVIDSKKGKKQRIDLGKMKALKDAGWSRKDIAEELKCSLQSVHKYWNNL